MKKTDTSSFLRAESELILDHARQRKAEKTKNLGSPLRLPGTPLALEIHGNDAWIAENTAQVRVINLESGKTKSTFKGHMGPVTSIAFADKVHGSGDNKIMVTGSWDKTIKVWDTETRELLSSTAAHSDFVKTLFVFVSLKLLVSGGSDKVVRLWDLSMPTSGKPLASPGSISSHTRPIECLDGQVQSDRSAILYTADTMGVIKVWELEKEDDSPSSRWRCTLKRELNYHRTRVNDMVVGHGYIWTASADETVQIYPYPSPDSSTSAKAITAKTGIKTLLPLQLSPLEEPYLIIGSGDLIRAYDMSSLDSPAELLSTVDAHWHDVTILKLWLKLSEENNIKKIEPWIISGSLDGTIRKWKLHELLNPPPTVAAVTTAEDLVVSNGSGLTEDEERELDELLDSDAD